MVAVGPLKLKVQLFCADWHALGPGKADLLEAIDREGSILAAGRAMGMSYRKCWMLVDRMNRTWVGALVETRLGGGPKSGARLTDLGREVLRDFRALEAHVAGAAANEANLAFLLQRLLPAPKERRSETKP